MIDSGPMFRTETEMVLVETKAMVREEVLLRVQLARYLLDRFLLARSLQVPVFTRVQLARYLIARSLLARSLLARPLLVPLPYRVSLISIFRE